ncbi:hypothetical protein CQA38_08580 [Campylobacter sp. MIT 12-5580]|uniref:glycosyltransferase n=1 Tax=Campylobacter sp. MIT 12-5580 TaxID=2040651 RepID=UPI0010F9CEA6|nr:glycosyltransferase [Campylobacter sp. MIT 12-5580]TKX28188.1 hypothetical protein CQA38_08580 [Campylobacter sp. MIT 12-5580]
MFHIALVCSNEHCKFAAVAMCNVIDRIDPKKKFKDMFDNSKINKELQDYKKLDYNCLSTEEQEEGCVFHILTDGIDDSNLAKLNELETILNKKYPCKLQIHKIATDFLESKGAIRWKGSYAIWLRIFIVSFIPKDVNLCLYIDSDMIINCDLRELFTLDLGDKILSSYHVFTNENWFIKNKQNPNEQLKLCSEHYNLAVVLFHCRNWEKHNIYEKCLNIINSYLMEENFLCDESVLHAVLDASEFLALPQTYDFFLGRLFKHRFLFLLLPYLDEESIDVKQTINKKDISFYHQNAKIIHFLPVLKPWEYSLQINYFNESELWHKYYKIWWNLAYKCQPFLEDFKILERKLLFIFYTNEQYLKNRLFYKLGYICINQKNILLPFSLIFSYIKHKIWKRKFINYNQITQQFHNNQENLKIEESFCYELGKLLAKAAKNWYKGGFLKFLFIELPKLKKDKGKN